ncbi:dnaJ homolog subfamily C member 7-like [Branchiostoma floridae]|uniref:DnaJ homolog subfamily C member 7-like n=1 Tax=Branchiostoma floridae TaxID=7739 RepID=A0A9J7HUA0_BRAFL|nr:dnaJ homolog subfamily C member 7-like [Branchiostoma floridae]
MSTTTEQADDKENAETDKVKRPTKRRSDEGVGGHQRLTNSKAWSSASRNVSSDHSGKRLRFNPPHHAVSTPQTPRSKRSGEYEKAYDLYTEALTIDPENRLTNAKLYNNRAAVCVKLGRLNDAIQDCTQAIELDSSYVKAISRRATCYMETECFEEAIRDFETLYKLNPTPENEKLLREATQKQKMSMKTDFYKILGVERFATADEIKKAYRKLALKCHPDKHVGASEDEKIAMEKKFKAIGEAHKTLSDPVERAKYDEELSQSYLKDLMSDRTNAQTKVNVNTRSSGTPFKSRFTFHYV